MFKGDMKVDAEFPFRYLRASLPEQWPSVTLKGNCAPAGTLNFRRRSDDPTEK